MSGAHLFRSVVSIAMIALVIPAAIAAQDVGDDVPVEQTMYFSCDGETGIGNIDTRQGHVISWGPEHPTSSDDGCVHLTRPPTTELTSPEKFTASGVADGLLDTVTFRMWATACCVSTYTDPVMGIGLSTMYSLVVDDQELLAPTEIVASPIMTHGAAALYEVTLTGVGLTDPETDLGPHEVTVQLYPLDYGPHENTVYYWGHRDLSSGLTFNATEPADHAVDISAG